MKKDENLTGDELLEERQKKMNETIESLIDFFELNEIPPNVGIQAMLKLMLKMFRKNNASSDQLRKLFDYAIRAYVEEK